MAPLGRLQKRELKEPLREFEARFKSDRAESLDRRFGTLPVSLLVARLRVSSVVA